jgi:hypothetical protein
MTTTSFFTREFFTKKNMAVVPHPPYVSLFLRFKIELKGRHFDTIEVPSQNKTSRMYLKMA